MRLQIKAWVGTGWRGRASRLGAWQELQTDSWNKRTKHELWARYDDYAQQFLSMILYDCGTGCFWVLPFQVGGSSVLRSSAIVTVCSAHGKHFLRATCVCLRRMTQSGTLFSLVVEFLWWNPVKNVNKEYFLLIK